jgi:succinyl-CoA synthetase beta subunit
MNIHEYQAKELLRKYGVFTPRGYPCFDVDEVVKAAKRLGRVVIKPQVHLGGDTLSADAYLATSREEARIVATRILGAPANAAGKKVKRLLVEEAVAGENRFQLVATRVNAERIRLTARLLVQGDVVNTSRTPGKVIHEEPIDAATGLTDRQAQVFLEKLGLPEAARAQARAMLMGVCAMCIERGAEKIEINPVVLTCGEAVLAGGARVNFSEESLVIHPEIGAMRDPDEAVPDPLASV